MSATAALEPGTKAPLFTLPTTSGTKLSLAESLSQTPVIVLSFFKVSCPVCQFAFPYLERIHRSYPSVPIWGVSQDDSDATNAFARSYGVSFPIVMDEHLQTTVDYGLTNVPSTFLITRDSAIVQTIVGFAKLDFEQLNQRVAELCDLPFKKLFTDADDVPALKPG